jgi:uncharacterized repeat protein (TIGR01451 family)
MKLGPATRAASPPWPRWWRLVLIALGTLILCSCRAAPPAACSGYPGPPSPALPQQAFTGEPAAYPGMPGAYQAAAEDAMVAAPCPAAYPGPAAAMPVAPAGPWAPPGLRSNPWPQDEYLCDGGDAVPHATVSADWEINGLNVEDTIAHFDTVDGRRLVSPSNRVCIYSPRFSSVRQVVSLRENEQRNPWADVYQPTKLVRHDEVQIAASSEQQYQPRGEVGRKEATTFLSEQGDGAVSNANGPLAFQDKLLPYEAPLAIGQGIVEESEMAWLGYGVSAAITWSGDQPVQVFIDRTKAAAEVSDEKLATVFTVKSRETNPKLRVIKVASTQFAAPGATIDFTIRFDNVGDDVIGNVTVVDNLTTRLEYVPDTAQCSVPAEFSTQPNEGESLALRWEITNPLERGQGGIIRFRCRVR